MCGLSVLLHHGPSSYSTSVTAHDVENAPSSFPLLSSMDREKGEAAKLEQSPLAYLIAEQEAEFDLFDQIIRMTETQLGKLEGRHPERLNFV